MRSVCAGVPGQSTQSEPCGAVIHEPRAEPRQRARHLPSAGRQRVIRSAALRSQPRHRPHQQEAVRLPQPTRRQPIRHGLVR